MRKNLTLGALALLFAPGLAVAQLSFTNATPLMSASTSGGCMGVVDMNGDGLDDIAKLNNSRTVVVNYQNADGSFTTVNYGNISNSGQWGWAIGDIDNNGHKDVVSGGSYDGTHHMNIPSIGSSSVSNLNNGSLFTQCVNIADINNDGHNDYWACHDDAAPRQWLNNGSGLLTYADIITYTTNPTSDMSGNYGSVWTDFDNDGDLDLYIAKCRQGVNDPNDPRRWNRLFVNNGNNQYTDQALAYGVQVRNQSWTADFGDIDNDGDFDLMLTNHDATIQLFENDGTGNYTEITAGSGLEYSGFMLQSKFVDFDNDGFVDILIAGGVEYYFKNDGDGTFTRITGLFPSNKAMHSFATGDLNNDGFQDVFANYGSGYIDADPNNPDRLWMNNGNDNHWFSVRLQGTISNRDAIGARVTITGPWGTQIREVRAGESYGMVTSFACSFGLGTSTTIPTMTIRWPSGLVETFNDLDVDQTITVIENTCISPIATITADGPFIVCGNGDEVTLTANAGFNYSWSNDATTQSIQVTQAGNYSVTIDDGQGCSAITSVFVAQAPDETPTVTVDGETTFCEGGTVQLTSSPASGYNWSNGANTQAISVSQSGTYTVTIDGACGEWTSSVVTLNVLDAPEAPVADDVTIPLAGTADLTATGSNVLWYTTATGGAPAATGSTWTTPFVNSTTSFWVASSNVFGGGTFYGGCTNNATNGQYHTNADNYQLFTASEPFTLRSVKVYANGAGNRTIAMIDQGTGATLATGVFSIPNGESRVQLDFEVPAGGPYGLRVVGGNPQLWRDGLGSNPAYPYALGTVGTITSSSVAGNNATAYYYFFYDWEVEVPSTVCESAREEVVVNVGTVGVNEAGAGNGIAVWPNPATDNLTVVLNGVDGEVSVDMLDLTGRVVLERGVQAAATRMDLNVGALAAGEYVVRVRHSAGVSVHRVVVR
jgi:hypothetical protein